MAPDVLADGAEVFRTDREAIALGLDREFVAQQPGQVLGTAGDKLVPGQGAAQLAVQGVPLGALLGVAQFLPFGLELGLGLLTLQVECLLDLALGLECLDLGGLGVGQTPFCSAASSSAIRAWVLVNAAHCSGVTVRAVGAGVGVGVTTTPPLPKVSAAVVVTVPMVTAPAAKAAAGGG